LHSQSQHPKKIMPTIENKQAPINEAKAEETLLSPAHSIRDAEGGGAASLETSNDRMGIETLAVDDDPSLNPWTFRSFLVGTS
jgi:hypothetical protein